MKVVLNNFSIKGKIKLASLIAATLLFFACSSGDTSQGEQAADSTNIEQQAAETEQEATDTSIAEAAENGQNIENDADFTAKYVCPNHCEGSGSDEPGVCPVCGMELVENVDYKGSN